MAASVAPSTTNIALARIASANCRRSRANTLGLMPWRSMGVPEEVSLAGACQDNNLLRLKLLYNVRRMGGNNRLSHLTQHEPRNPPLGVRRQRYLWFLHCEDHSLLILELS